MSASPPPRRRVLPQPIETTTRSRKQNGHEESKTEAMAQADFAPQPGLLPVGTSSKNRAQAGNQTPQHMPGQYTKSSSETSQDSIPTPRRKFAPQLIETTARSKKSGDTRPATLLTDKTDITPGTNHIYLPAKKARPKLQTIVHLSKSNAGSGTVTDSQISPLPPRRQSSMRPHPNTRRSTRQNSFQPELEPILSEDLENEDDEEDEDDGTPSLTASYGSSDDSIMRLQLARTRESCDDRFSGYLLALAAKAAEKQLREQALAAFPNSDFHEVVEHFYDREVEPGPDDGDIEGVGMLSDEIVGEVLRRKSTEVGWAAQDMQDHQEKLARMREDETHVKVAAEASKPTFKDPFWTNGMTNKGPLAEIKKESEMMRNAASPPMLGADLLFRRCPSPKATKFETDQNIEVKPNRRADGGGLWNGYCIAEEDEQYLSPAPRGPPMIQTPSVEHDDPFASAFRKEVPAGVMSPGTKSRPTSSKGLHLLAGIDDRLKVEAIKLRQEEAFQQEFNDEFVTQVYNYLSLGYPSLARQYDEELSIISKVPEQELSKEDTKKDFQGHIGLKAKAKGAEPETRSPRWLALRVYILEWAQQHPSMAGADPATPGAWGVRARRGSWAI